MSLERTNQPTGAEAMVLMLPAYGVVHMFGLVGDLSLIPS